MEKCLDGREGVVHFLFHFSFLKFVFSFWIFVMTSILNTVMYKLCIERFKFEISAGCLVIVLMFLGAFVQFRYI